MVNFGLLTAKICWRVWGTPANFNGLIRVLAVLLHGILVVGVSQTAALNRGQHLYLAGRPSRWALAHILFLFVAAAAYSQLLCALLCKYLPVSQLHNAHIVRQVFFRLQFSEAKSWMAIESCVAV